MSDEVNELIRLLIPDFSPICLECLLWSYHKGCLLDNGAEPCSAFMLDQDQIRKQIHRVDLTLEAWL